MIRFFHQQLFTFQGLLFSCFPSSPHPPPFGPCGCDPPPIITGHPLSFKRTESTTSIPFLLLFFSHSAAFFLLPSCMGLSPQYPLYYILFSLRHLLHPSSLTLFWGDFQWFTTFSATTVFSLLVFFSPSVLSRFFC